MIEFQRNFLTPDLYQKVEYYCYRADYYYGEQDNPNQIPTGLVHDLNLDSEIVGYFPKEKNNIPLYRVYINLFNPGEKPHFHIDGNGYTSLFYINNDPYYLDEGGCTEILTHEDYITSILPMRNSLVTFEAKLKHRATSFKTLPRFTLALKYEHYTPVSPINS